MARPRDLGALARVLLLPVRHHSPRAAAFVAAELARVRPRVVLVEGPSDASELCGVLADAETRPPVAILGYRTDGITQSALWPFADYSPELVAIRWAAAHGAEVRFIDLPVGVALATMRARPGLEVHEGEGESFDGGSDERSSESGESGESADSGERIADPDPDFAARVGMRSFDEAWDARRGVGRVDRGARARSRRRARDPDRVRGSHPRRVAARRRARRGDGARDRRGRDARAAGVDRRRRRRRARRGVRRG
jgi:hypothetical protein